MKNLFLLLVCALTVTLVSCGGDDGCETDLSGTYTGTDDCAGVTTTATVTISGEDGDYSISGLYTANLDQDGCSLSWSEAVFGIGPSYEITLSGDEITIVEMESATNIVLCTFTGTK